MTLRFREKVTTFAWDFDLWWQSEANYPAYHPLDADLKDPDVYFDPCELYGEMN